MTGNQIAAEALANGLKKLLPLVAEQIDMSEIGQALADEFDAAALDFIDSRERAFSAALSAVMEYDRGVIESLREQIRRLRDERQRTELRLARTVKTEEVPDDH